jgi:ParB-like chromosome segregation protein Spo0J
MTNTIKTIKVEQLLPHPDNPNRMSKANFAKIVRHIERTGRYEPLTVRRHPQYDWCFQIINGHHRFEALKQLGYESCDCVVWDIDDDETNLLLATLNRLCGQDELDAKCALLDKLNAKLKVEQLAKLLPQTKTQIRRLIDLHKEKTKIELTQTSQQAFAHSLVFFLTAEQKQVVERALLLVPTSRDLTSKAQRNAQAITYIAEYFIEHRQLEMTDGDENQVCAIRTCPGPAGLPHVKNDP